MNAEKSKHPPSKKLMTEGIERPHCMHSTAFLKAVWKK
jgi:hypothetical protein